MVERKRITLIYEVITAWIGGSYYILNIIKALNQLDDNEKPHLTILIVNKSSLSEINKLNYPYINFLNVTIKFNLIQKVSNRIWRICFNSNLFFNKLPFKEIDNVYPYNPIYKSSKNIKYVYWIADFQEHYLPQFFTDYELQVRLLLNNLIVKSNKPVVFSSFNALTDFNKFYPGNKNETHVVQFKSFINDDYKLLDIDLIYKKYNISTKYFIVSNQFWSHKNHIVVLKAAKKLIESGSDIQIVLTGKEFDYRNPGYSKNLRAYVDDNKLNNYILFLGLIDRNEQIQLLKNSVAIIQPSLFEGWSTVVEDAKAINKFIIVSDIALHREQISDNCLFFDPQDEVALANQMQSVLDGSSVEISNDYNKEIIDFARAFLKVFNK